MGTFLEVHWLRLCLPVQGVGVDPCSGSEEPTCLWAEEPNCKTSNIVTDLIETLKMVHIKVIFFFFF